MPWTNMPIWRDRMASHTFIPIIPLAVRSGTRSVTGRNARSTGTHLAGEM